MEEALGGFTLVVALFLIVLAILWFILPFAIFGTKARLDSLILRQEKQIALLERLVEQGRQQAMSDGAIELTAPVRDGG